MIEASVETEIAVLKEQVGQLIKNQNSYHVKANSFHKEMNLLRIDVRDLGSKFNSSMDAIKSIMEENKDVKVVVSNNTEALNAVQILIAKMQTEKETRKSTIVETGKVIIFSITIIGALYAAYLKLKNII